MSTFFEAYGLYKAEWNSVSDGNWHASEIVDDHTTARPRQHLLFGPREGRQTLYEESVSRIRGILTGIARPEANAENSVGLSYTGIRKRMLRATKGLIKYDDAGLVRVPGNRKRSLRLLKKQGKSLPTTIRQISYEKRKRHVRRLRIRVKRWLTRSTDPGYDIVITPVTPPPPKQRYNGIPVHRPRRSTRIKKVTSQ